MYTDTFSIYRVSIPSSLIYSLTASIGTSSLWKIPAARRLPLQHQCLSDAMSMVKRHLTSDLIRDDLNIVFFIFKAGKPQCMVIWKTKLRDRGASTMIDILFVTMRNPGNFQLNMGLFVILFQVTGCLKPYF